MGIKKSLLTLGLIAALTSPVSASKLANEVIGAVNSGLITPKHHHGMIGQFGYSNMNRTATPIDYISRFNMLSSRSNAKLVYETGNNSVNTNGSLESKILDTWIAQRFQQDPRTSKNCYVRMNIDRTESNAIQTRGIKGNTIKHYVHGSIGKTFETVSGLVHELGHIACSHPDRLYDEMAAMRTEFVFYMDVTAKHPSVRRYKPSFAVLGSKLPGLHGRAWRASIPLISKIRNKYNVDEVEASVILINELNKPDSKIYSDYSER